MAKRLKLAKLFDPEVDKLHKLEDEMHKTAMSNRPQIDEKLQNYEELLAQYRELKEKLERRGPRIWRKILEDGGVLFKEGKVYIPLNSSDRKAQKRSTSIYAEPIFDNAVQYLSNPRPKEKLLKKIFDVVREKVNVNEYPNLMSVRDQHTAKLNGKWTFL